MTAQSLMGWLVCEWLFVSDRGADGLIDERRRIGRGPEPRGSYVGGAVDRQAASSAFRDVAV